MKIISFLILFFINIYANDILILSTNIGKISQEAKINEFINVSKKYNLKVDFKFENELKKEEILNKFSKYKIIIFDSLAGERSVISMYEKYNNILKNLNNIVILSFIKKENLYIKNITLEDNKIFNEYWNNGGEYNFINLSIFIKNKLLKTSNKTYNKAIVIPKDGIYHPKKENLIFNTLEEYAKFFKLNLQNLSKPLIAIGLHRGSIVSNNLEHINEIIKYLEEKGFQTLPFFTDVTGDDFIGKKFLTYKNKTIVDVIINFQLMIINHEKLKNQYKKLNIPILHALYYSKGDIQNWYEDKHGIEFSMIPMTYIIPETIGYFDSLIVSAQDKISKKLKPIPSQLYSLANKAINISNLKRKENKDKNIAIMYYNYPFGVNNMGASFLNIPQSLEEVFKALVKDGYSTISYNEKYLVKESSKALKLIYKTDFSNIEDEIIKNDNAVLYPLSEYLKFFNKLPSKLKEEMKRVWKEPLDSQNLFCKDKKCYFVIPRKKFGNILLLPQPRRAQGNNSIEKHNSDITKDDTRLWHNPLIPISHSYLATYLYVTKQFNADAIVHFGTHGTQEWTPGKQRGLSIYDSALVVLNDTPIIYPYITNNLAEAIQAKRRGRATLISHQTPPFSLTGTYKELSEIMDLINQYNNVDKGILKEQLKRQIIDLTIKVNINKDINFKKDMILKDFKGYLSKVEDYILSASKQAMPLGMHTFGIYPKKEHLISTLLQMLGNEFIEIVEGDKNFFTKNYQKFKESKSFKLIDKFVINNKDFKELENQALKPYLQLARKYKEDFENTMEIKNFLRALKGEYIQTGIGGDPIRNPNSLPTGINMYGFDPSKVPTKAAYKTGSKLMKNFISNYYKENKKYPNKLTFNLWSLETMRHYGVLESQILYAMGVKPIWNETGISNKIVQNMAKTVLQSYLGESFSTWLSSFITVPMVDFVLSLTPKSWFLKAKKILEHSKATVKGEIVDIEIIPYKKLKRPRIDVVISVTGLYRDTFPQTIKILAKAVEKVSKLNEKDNYLRQNTLALEKKLNSLKNITKQEALYLSTIRVFSNKIGDYGSGVGDISKSARWENDKRISQNYVQTLGYYYGSDITRWGEKNVELDLYSKNLSGTNAVLFSRTSNLYGLLTSDDPFEYFGSISMAIRNIDKKSVKTYISNLRDTKNSKIEDTSTFMAKELRGRYFHPKWIKKMKEEGYSGTLGVLAVMDNFWGWQVVDPNIVRNDQWQEFVEVYVNDKYNLKLQEWFENFNPNAFASFVEKIIEASRKGYFKTDEKTLKKLIELYKNLEDKFKIKTYNKKFKKFVNKKASGYGLMSIKNKPTSQKEKNLQELKKVETPLIKGQKLEKVEEKIDNKIEKLLYIFLFTLIILGVLIEYRKKD